MKKPMNIARKISLGLGLVGLLLTIAITGYYYYQQTNLTPPVASTVTKHFENTELKELVAKIKTLQAELTQDHLTPEAKANLEKIIKKHQEKEQNLKNFLTFQDYMNYLVTEIKACENQLKANEANQDNSFTKQHHLAEKKLTQEKELLALKEKQKLFTERTELQTQVLKDLQEKLKNPQLTATDKTTLETEQTKLTTRLTTINQEINNLITKIELKNKIAALTAEIATETDDNLKLLLTERQAIFQKQLENLV